MNQAESPKTSRARIAKAAFLCSSALILLATALAKVFSATGTAKMLSFPDPLLQVQYRFLLLAVGLVELATAGVLLSRSSDKLKFLSLFWLSLNFILYRLGFWFVGLPLKLCPCLGNLTDTLHINPERVDIVLRGIVFYFFAGSLVGLLCAVWNRWNSRAGSMPSLASSVR